MPATASVRCRSNSFHLPSGRVGAIRLDYRTSSKVCLVTLSALHGHFVVVVVVVVSAVVDVDD